MLSLWDSHLFSCAKGAAVSLYWVQLPWEMFRQQMGWRFSCNLHLAFHSYFPLTDTLFSLNVNPTDCSVHPGHSLKSWETCKRELHVAFVKSEISITGECLIVLTTKRTHRNNLRWYIKTTLCLRGCIYYLGFTIMNFSPADHHTLLLCQILFRQPHQIIGKQKPFYIQPYGQKGWIYAA